MWANEENGATTMSESLDYLTSRGVEAIKVEEI
jgi:hypothetical protein